MQAKIKGMILCCFMLYAWQAQAMQQSVVFKTSTPSLLPNAGCLSAILKRGVLRVVMLHTVPAFIISLGNGHYTGLDVVFAKSIAQKMKVKEEIYLVDDPQNLLKWVRMGRVDLALSNITNSLYSQRYVQFSHPYLTTHFAMLANRYQAEILGFGKTPASYSKKETVLGYVDIGDIGKAINQYFPLAQKKHYSSYRVALAALKNKKINCLLGNQIILNALYAKSPLSALRIEMIVLSDNYHFSSITFRGNAWQLKSWFNELIQEEEKDPGSVLARAQKKYGSVPMPFTTGTGLNRRWIIAK